MTVVPQAHTYYDDRGFAITTSPTVMTTLGWTGGILQNAQGTPSQPSLHLPSGNGGTEIRMRQAGGVIGLLGIVGALIVI